MCSRTSASASSRAALRGAATTFAAPGTYEAALRLEEMGRAGELSAALEALAALKQEFDRLRPALAVLVESGL